VHRGAAFPVTQAAEMAHKITAFQTDPEYYQSICNICKTYVTQNLGATETILMQMNNEQ
jgi:flagellum-specific peptidoglycan hydrolase FlgJ